MNRAKLRESKKVGRAMMNLPENEFEEISYFQLMMLSTKIKPNAAWKNNHYVVQLYKNERVLFGKLMDKWMIRRNDSEPITEWHALQNIKNKVIGVDEMAIQVFPKDSELVDVANMYWLFTESKT